MVDYKINAEKEEVRVIKKSQNEEITREIVLSFSELDDITKAIDKEVYFREDIIDELKRRIDEKLCPTEAIENNEYIEALLDVYNKCRLEYNSGLNDMLHWAESIKMAFDTVDYEKYL